MQQEKREGFPIVAVLLCFSNLCMLASFIKGSSDEDWSTFLLGVLNFFLGISYLTWFCCQKDKTRMKKWAMFLIIITFLLMPIYDVSAGYIRRAQTTVYADLRGFGLDEYKVNPNNYFLEWNRSSNGYSNTSRRTYSELLQGQDMLAVYKYESTYITEVTSKISGFRCFILSKGIEDYDHAYLIYGNKVLNIENKLEKIKQ